MDFVLQLVAGNLGAAVSFGQFYNELNVVHDGSNTFRPSFGNVNTSGNRLLIRHFSRHMQKQLPITLTRAAR